MATLARVLCESVRYVLKTNARQAFSIQYKMAEYDVKTSIDTIIDRTGVRMTSRVM
jgi:hypothetical protein